MNHDLIDEQGNWLAPVDPFAADITSVPDMLNRFLERQRATFAWKLSGLSTNQLRATHAPSVMTLAGMLKHLARYEDDLSTEFILGESQLSPWNAVDWETDRAWDWRTATDESADLLYTRWRDAVRRSRPIVQKAIESGTSAQPLVYVLANSIEEYARHNGHIDLIRESIDGLVGHDPDFQE